MSRQESRERTSQGGERIRISPHPSEKLWETMKQKGMTQYRLIKEFHFSNGQLDRLRKNENLSTHTLDELCTILDCRLEDIAEYIRDE